MLRLVTLAGFTALAAGQSTYVANGGMTSMDQAVNWQGASPLTPNNLPTATTLGLANQATVASVPAGANYDLGNGLTFNGQAKIVFMANTGITFGGNTGRSQPATFAPPTGTAGAQSPSFNWNCNLNWLVNGAIPARAPCNNDMVQFPSTSTYYLSTYGQRGAAFSLSVQGSTDSVTQCPASGGSSVMVGDLASVNVGNCPSQFQFPGQAATGFSCPNPGISSACVPSSAGSGGIVTGPAFDGSTYTVITQGPFAGRAFQSTGGSTINDVSTSAGGVGITEAIAATSTTNGVYMIGNTTYDGRSGAVQQATPAPAPASESSSGSAVGGSTAILIVVIVVAVIIILVVVVVVTKKNKNASASPATAGAVSFENPMYDDASKGETSTDNGLYTEPAYAEGTGGYMDVPAGEGEATDGYMDMPGEGGETSGYMDVDPEDDDDV